ncbi:MAG: hypothetical protein CMA63_08240 [Euryarchaeota archaeon]|nr:hypothetical protein [Euryarchaeota archaeon]|tara:strand:- start:32378 stop:33469 length:1092 start_codon:yes stop_codon:yes gene_type:complete
MNLKVFSILGILLLSSLSGCLSGDSNDEEVTLKILTYDINALSDELIGQFTNQTGIQVEFIRTDDAGGILDQMMLTQSAPLADLMIGLDNTYLPTAIENGLLMEHSASMDNFTSSSLEFYQGPLAIPFDEGDVCLNYDEDALAAANMTVPTSLWNLTEPEWNGKMAFPSPMTSSPGRAFLTATVDYFSHAPGNESGNMSQWWSSIADNNAIFTSGWTEAYETYYTGGYGIWSEGYLGGAYLTVSYCHSPGVEAFYSENYTHSTSLVLPRASFHQVEYAGIINGASEVEAANLFIEFLTSSEVNVNMPENNLMYSILEGTDLPETNGYRFHADDAIQSNAITQAMIEQSMDDWLAEWQEAVRTN